VGVVVDAVSEVLRVSRSGVDALPAMLAREGNLAEVTSICRLDNGKRLVSIVTARNLFGHSVNQGGTERRERKRVGQRPGGFKQDDNLDDDEQVVIFRLDKEEFGAPIASVQEIVRVPEQLIRVPKAPSFVEGVINLRGTVLPVIDLRLRLGLKQVERTDRQRIMVFLIADVRTGFTLFQAEGDFEIRQARNGDEAVRENREFQPHVVTLDINMPEMDGLTALSLIMAERPVAVVMVSSLTNEGALATFEALNLGAVDYVSKPGGTISLSIDKVITRATGGQGTRRRAGTAEGQTCKEYQATGAVVRRMQEERAMAAAASTALVCAARACGGRRWPAGHRRVDRRAARPRDCAVGIAGKEFPWPVLVAQHMPAAFTRAVRRAAGSVLRAVRLSRQGSALPVEPGKCLHRAGWSGHPAGQRESGKLAHRSCPRPRIRSTCGTPRSNCSGDRCCSTTIRSGQRPRCC
jgi:chemotaxis signal transduction protein